MLKKKFLSVLPLILLLLTFSHFAFADESLTITTYYPSPYGSYRELRAQHIAIGTNYITSSYCWSPTVCANQFNSDLAVEGNVSIGVVASLAKLHVVGGATRGIYATSNITGIEGGSVAGNGIVGTSQSATASGVYGSNTINGNGVYGISNAGPGVYGRSNSGGNGVIGIDGGWGSGVYGGSTRANGVYGLVNNANSGVVGQNLGAGVGVNGVSATGYGVYCTGASCGGNKVWTNTSDERLKKNIVTIRSALDKVERLRGVSYEWKDEKYKGREIGFIAQEVKRVVPEVVSQDPNGYYAMKTSQITAILVEAIKEQQKQIEALKKQIEALKKKSI